MKKLNVIKSLSIKLSYELELSNEACKEILSSERSSL